MLLYQLVLARWVHNTFNDATHQEVYARLQQLSTPRLLVDKSPTYAENIEPLRRAEVLFADPLHLPDTTSL